MPDQYFVTPFFRLSLAAFFIVAGIELLVWYNTVAAPTPGTWIPLLAYIFLSFIMVFFPSGSLNMPAMLVPAVILVTLLNVQIMLGVVPHNLTPATLAMPLTIVVMVCSVMIQRNHFVSAWVLFVISTLLMLKWHLDIYTPRMTILAIFLIPAAILAANHIFKRQIDQSLHKARQSRVLLQNAELGQEQEHGVSSVAAQRVAEVRSLTEDMLHRIAYNPSPVTRAEIDDFRFTEAQLRDTIRGRHVVNQEILQATFAARHRGAKVDILDERGEPLPSAVVRSLTTCAVDLLDSATGGTITIRAFPKDDPIAVMLVHDGNCEEDEPSAIEIAQGTGAIERF